MASTSFIQHAPYEKYYKIGKNAQKHWQMHIWSIRNAITEYNRQLNPDTEMELYLTYELIWNDNFDVDPTDSLVCLVLCSDQMDNQWEAYVYM